MFVSRGHDVSAVIRPARVPDAPWLAELAERTFRETYTAYNTPEDMERYVAEHFAPELQAAELSDPRYLTLVVEMHGRPAAYAQLGHRPAPEGVTGPEPMEIIRFYVDRPWHGRGIAQELMRAAAEHAQAAGARTLWLCVWERNPRAIAFYRKCGFTEVGTHTFVLGSDHQRDLVLERPIP
jgi:ribosomal protein S18 acetylase RimI-like enzyme